MVGNKLLVCNVKHWRNFSQAPYSSEIISLLMGFAQIFFVEVYIDKEVN